MAATTSQTHIPVEMEEALDHKQEVACNTIPTTKIITNRCAHHNLKLTIWFRTGWCHHRSPLVDLERRADRVESEPIIRINNNFKMISQSILILIGTTSRQMLRRTTILMKDMANWDRVRTFLAAMDKGNMIHIKSLKVGSCSLQIEWLRLVDKLKLLVHQEEAMRYLSLREAHRTHTLRQRLQYMLITMDMTTSVRIPTRKETKKMISMKNKMLDQELVHLDRSVVKDSQQLSKTEMKQLWTTQNAQETVVEHTGTNQASMKRNQTSSWLAKCMECRITAISKKKGCTKICTTKW